MEGKKCPIMKEECNFKNCAWGLNNSFEVKGSEKKFEGCMLEAIHNNIKALVHDKQT